MFRFEHIEHLFAFAALPVLILFFALMWFARKRVLARLGEEDLIRQLMPDLSRYKHGIKFTLLMLALSCLIIAWANPQFGSKREKVKRKSVDVFIALDISRSMLAEDLRPSRLDRAKQFAMKLVEELRGERIGLILFAGNAYLQTPLTTDYSAVLLFLRSANPNLAPTQGTAIGEAVELAERSFEQNNKHHKVMVVISDGEDHDDASIERTKEANDNGLLLFSVGVGTAEGGFIPVEENGRSEFKRDKAGNPVRSRIDEAMLGQVAEAGGGVYFNLSQGSNIADVIRDRIDGMEKRELEQRSFSEYESYFQYFLFAAILLLLIEFLISFRKSNRWGNKDLFEA